MLLLKQLYTLFFHVKQQKASQTQHNINRGMDVFNIILTMGVMMVTAITISLFNCYSGPTGSPCSLQLFHSCSNTEHFSSVLLC